MVINSRILMVCSCYLIQPTYSKCSILITYNSAALVVSKLSALQSTGDIFKIQKNSNKHYLPELARCFWMAGKYICAMIFHIH